MEGGFKKARHVRQTKEKDGRTMDREAVAATARDHRTAQAPRTEAHRKADVAAANNRTREGTKRVEAHRTAKPDPPTVTQTAAAIVTQYPHQTKMRTPPETPNPLETGYGAS